MSIFDGNYGIVITKRDGTPSNPYVSITESLKVNLNRIILRELPSKFNGVTISNGTTTLFVVDSNTNDTPTSNTVICDYNQGYLTFHSSHEGTTWNITYMGTGVWAINYNRVFTSNSGNTITATLKDAEDSRVTSENNRVTQENSRISSENARISSEAARASSESTRASNETTRQTNMINIQTNMTLVHKGTVASYTSLPTSNRVVGDVWVVTSDADSTKNGSYRWQSDNTWLKIYSYTTDGKETISNVSVVDKAKAAIIRDSVHSGVTQWSDITYMPTTANKIKLSSDLVTYLNGYKVVVPKDTEITLPTAGTFGTREDLVFLETYFPSNGNGYEMSYRIRTITGVDFSLYSPEGFVSAAGATNTNFKAQGGLADATIDALGNFYNQANRNSTGSAGRKVALDDVGLYVAGDGSSTSKTTLLSADGYVYAVPLFRVKRRNSGGYRKDNLNGARDYISTTFTVNTPAMDVGKSYDITVTSTTGFKNGDTINLYTSNTAHYAKVNEVKSSTVLNVEYIRGINGSIFFNTASLALVSDRPDSLFSNIISSDDIIDLRHKVSLTGVNYQQALEENFDKLLRGEQTTKDTKTTIKETYGLMKAPFYLKQELQEVEIKRADGTSAKLKNELGVDGNCESVSVWTTNQSTFSLDSSNKVYGNNSLKITLTATNGTALKNIYSLIDKTKYYVLIADFKNGTATNAYVYLSGAGMTSKSGNVITGSANFSVSYMKISPTDLTNATTLNAQGYVTGTSGQYAYMDGMRLYQIDQATYNLIDVDANWTGGDKIGVLFPYVDSLPNVVENLLDVNATPTLASATITVDEPNGITIASTSSGTFRNGYFSLNLAPSATYYIKANSTRLSGTSGGGIGITDSTGSAIVSANTNLNPSFSFVTPSSGAIRVYFYATNSTSESGSVKYTNIQLEQGSISNPFVPFGKFYIPSDYQGFNTHLGNTSINRYDGTNGGRFTAQRSIYSDAQTSETRTDIVEALKTPQSHIKVTQATEGIWAINDKIVISSIGGVVSGVIDSDTALAKVVQNVDYNNVILDDVSKLAVNDTFIIFIDGNFGTLARTITAIDSTAKKITFTPATSGDITGYFLVETTASTSLPTVTATGIAGTWTGLGTNKAEYTITTAPTTNTTNISIGYSVNYPAGKGFSYVPTDVLEGYVNDQKLVKGTTVSVKANYVGKVSANTDLIAHSSWRTGTNPTGISALLSPSAAKSSSTAWFSELIDSNIGLLDGSVGSSSNSNNLGISQHLFSFDLIRAVEDKYGEIPADGVAAKVTWLKANVSKFTTNWHGYGSAPLGNKANLKMYSAGGWYYGTSHTNGTVSKLQAISAANDLNNIIQSDGFLHILAHAEASDGVTASTINTDFVDLEIELIVAETGFTVLQPDNQMPVLSENILTQNQAFPVDTSSFNSDFVAGTMTYSIESAGVLKVVTGNTASGEGVSTYINPYRAGATYSYSAYVWGSGTIYLRASDGVGSTISTTVTLSSTPQLVTITRIFATSPTRNAFAVVTSSQQAATFYISKLKVQEGSVATSWSAGRNKKKILNVLGKISGSTVENPNKAFAKATSTFSSPSTFGAADEFVSSYANVAKQDGVLASHTNSTNGNYYQQLYEFDLSHLGMSLKELKAALRKITVSWTGYGSGSNGGVQAYGGTMKIWKPSTASWLSVNTNTSSVPASTTAVSDTSTSTKVNEVITNDQKYYVLVHGTYASDGVIASEVFTDYVKLEVELADFVDYVPSAILKVRPETKEVKLGLFNVHSYKYIGHGGGANKFEISYRFNPYQGQGSVAKSKILAVGSPIITTIGTGAKASDGETSLVGLSGLSTRLPSPVADYQLIAEKFTSEGVLTTFENLTLKQNPLVNSSYRVSPKVGIYFDPQSSVTEAIIRGNSIRPSLSTDTVTQLYAQAAYKFSLPTTLPSEALISLPMLIVENGELKMIVVSFRKSKSSVLQYYSTDGVYDSFKLQGRLLLKNI